MLPLLILKSLYLFLPAYVANMAPVLFRWLPFLDKPVQEKIFGKNKTWRGLVVATLCGGFIFFIQKVLYGQGFDSLAIIDYSDFSVLYGFLLGAGAILGDLVKSYLKRGYEVAPGERWFPWDQLDFVFLGLTFSLFMYVPPAEVVLILLIASPVLHILVNHIGYWLGIRKEKW